jgi:FKBP-type peptidyl-prolyl cis-trans isomerase FkpA
MNTKRKVVLAGLIAALFAITVPMFFVFGGPGGGFKTTPNGLQYRYIVDKKETKAKIGDFITVHMMYKTEKDSLLFSSRSMNNNQPIEIPVSAPQYKGDAAEGFTFLGAGDSVEFKMPVDSIFKGQPMPPFAKSGEFIHMYVSVVKVETKEQREKSQMEMNSKQNGIDEQLIIDYCKTNNLKPEKTASGLYYIIDKKGDGVKVEAGKTISVNYTGKTLNGNTFDSSVDPKFNHVQPLDFAVGTGAVIKGWDEGMQLFNVGGKGLLLIPSSLGYGAQARGENLPANSVMIFEVEVVGQK